jgi:hypothetical protein
MNWNVFIAQPIYIILTQFNIDEIYTCESHHSHTLHTHIYIYIYIYIYICVSPTMHKYILNCVRIGQIMFQGNYSSLHA